MNDTKNRAVIFKIGAILFILIALFHLYSIIIPLDETPIWRHALFVGINIGCSILMYKRKKYFFWIAVLLSIQQYYSHGSYFLKLLKEEHKIHWLSIGVFLLLPFLLLLLWQEYRKNDQLNGHS